MLVEKGMTDFNLAGQTRLGRRGCEGKKEGKKKKNLKRSGRLVMPAPLCSNYVMKLFMFPVAYALGVILDCEREREKKLDSLDDSSRVSSEDRR
jgi:hypothetical protein